MRTAEPGSLLSAAERAAGSAYAPYSRYRVGAALLTASGKVVTGCNVENASYGLTICAERAAVARAVSDGDRDIRALAVVACGTAPPYPCGACRQVLAEFCAADTPVFVASAGNLAAYEQFALGELLSHGFGMDPAP